MEFTIILHEVKIKKVISKQSTHNSRTDSNKNNYIGGINTLQVSKGCMKRDSSPSKRSVLIQQSKTKGREFYTESTENFNHKTTNDIQLTFIRKNNVKTIIFEIKKKISTKRKKDNQSIFTDQV